MTDNEEETQVGRVKSSPDLPAEPPVYESPQPSTSKLAATSDYSLPSYASRASQQPRRDHDVLQLYKVPLIVDRDLSSSSISVKCSFPIPPTYSAVLKMGPPPVVTRTKRYDVELTLSGTTFSNRVPPPSYAEVEGSEWAELPREVSSAEVLLGPEPLYVLCPHCSSIVITDTYTQRSPATHFTALALCVFGCWPCCLMPYFMDSCKNTYHHCPVCNYFFGVYRPW